MVSSDMVVRSGLAALSLQRGEFGLKLGNARIA
jgi:hypothetical protein